MNKLSEDKNQTTTLALHLEGIVQRFGASLVLRGLNLALPCGEALALYGANGSGKSTLLKIIATALTPTRGTGKVFGFALGDALEVRKRSLIVSHSLGHYPELTGIENLEFACRMHLRNVPQENTKEVLTRVGLGNTKSRVRAYSSGMRKRLALAKMLLLQPALVLLDEPFAALDTSGKDLVIELLNAQRAMGATVLLSSHEPELARHVATLETSLHDGLLAKPQKI